MKKLIILLTLLLIPLGSSALPSDPVALTERIYKAENDSSEIVTVVREVRFVDDPSVTGAYRLVKVFVNKELRDQSIEQVGTVVFSDGRSADYIVKPEPAMINTLTTKMDEEFVLLASSSSGFSGVRSQNSFTYNGASPKDNQDEMDTALRQSANAAESLMQQDYKNRQMQDEQRRQIMDGQRELQYKLEKQNEVIRGQAAASIADGFQKSYEIVQRFSTPSPQISIPHEVWVSQNPTAQAEQQKEVDKLVAQGQWGKVARLVSDLSSPLLLNRTDNTRSWLNENPVPNALHHPLVVDFSRLPIFASPDLEYQKQLVGNLLQSVAATRGSLTGKVAEWARASVYLTQAAGVAEKKGKVERARELMDQARTIAAYLAGDDEGKTLTLSDNTFHFSRTGFTSDTYEAASLEDVNKAATHAFTYEMGDDDRYPNPLVVLQYAQDALAWPGIQIFEYATRDWTVDEKLRTAKIVAAGCDVAMGFVPPMAYFSDFYTVVTGKRLTTGEEVTPVEQAMAYESLRTFGIGSAESHITGGYARLEQHIAEEANEIKSILKPLEPYEAELIHGMREEIANAKSAELQIEILRDTTKTLRERMDYLGLDLKLTGKVSAEEADQFKRLQRAALGKSWEDSYHNGTSLYGGVLTSTPKEAPFVRLHSEGREMGSYVFPAKAVEGKSLAEIKEMGSLPGSVDDLTHVTIIEVRKGDRLLFSEVGKNAFGSTEGHVQIEILNLEPRMLRETQKVTLDPNGLFYLPKGRP